MHDVRALRAAWKRRRIRRKTSAGCPLFHAASAAAATALVVVVAAALAVTRNRTCQLLLFFCLWLERTPIELPAPGGRVMGGREGLGGLPGTQHVVRYYG